MSIVNYLTFLVALKVLVILMEAVSCLVFATTGGVSYLVAKSYLCYDFEQSSRLSLFSFILVATSSIGLLEMVVMEIIGVSTDSFRSMVWTILISILTWSTLFAVPCLMIRKLTVGIKHLHLRLTILFMLIILYSINLIIHLNREAISLEVANKKAIVGVFSTSVMFSFVSKIGVSIISMLSGFSIVYLPYEYFRYYDGIILSINKSSIEEDMAVILDNIRNDKMALAQINIEHEWSTDVESKGLLTSMIGMVFGSKQSAIDKTIDSHKKSAKTNQQILDNLFIDYSEILKEEKNMMASKGRAVMYCLEKSLAVCLVVYGGYKTITTLVYLLLGRNKPTDPVSTVLKMVVR